MSSRHVRASRPARHPDARHGVSARARRRRLRGVVRVPDPLRGGAARDPERIVPAVDAARWLAPFTQAGRALADDGCIAIATTCGFLARWQEALAAALPVPVLTSALLQVPLVARRWHFASLGRHRSLTPVRDCMPTALAARASHPARPSKASTPAGCFSATISTRRGLARSRERWPPTWSRRSQRLVAPQPRRRRARAGMRQHADLPRCGEVGGERRLTSGRHLWRHLWQVRDDRARMDGRGPGSTGIPARCGAVLLAPAPAPGGAAFLPRLADGKACLLARSSSQHRACATELRQQVGRRHRAERKTSSTRQWKNGMMKYMPNTRTVRPGREENPSGHVQRLSSRSCAKHASSAT